MGDYTLYIFQCYDRLSWPIVVRTRGRVRVTIRSHTKGQNQSEKPSQGSVPRSEDMPRIKPPSESEVTPKVKLESLTRIRIRKQEAGTRNKEWHRSKEQKPGKKTGTWSLGLVSSRPSN